MGRKGNGREPHIAFPTIMQFHSCCSSDLETTFKILLNSHVDYVLHNVNILCGVVGYIILLYILGGVVGNILAQYILGGVVGYQISLCNIFRVVLLDISFVQYILGGVVGYIFAQYILGGWIIDISFCNIF